MKSKLLFLATGLAFSAGAMAVPTLTPGPLYLQFNNLEQAGFMVPGFAAKDLNGDGTADVSGAEFNWGVFNVSSIQAGAVSTPHQDISGGTNYFNNDGTNGQVSGIFYGFQLGNAVTHLTGGYIDLYWHNAAADNITATDLSGAGGAAAAGRTDWNVAGKYTAGTFLARLQYKPGVITGDTSTTVSSTQDPLNLSGVGLADGFADVMDINNDGVIDGLDGAWAASINTDWFHVDPNNDGIVDTRDLRFSNFFQNQDLWDGANGVQGLRSNDPARAMVVSEPGILGLMGLGLVGLGFSRRRKMA